MYVPATSARPAAAAAPLMPIEIKVGGAPPAAAALSALGAEPARVSRMPRRLQRRTKAHRFAEAVSSSTRSFVRCVTMRESSMEWHIVDPPYSGGDQWTESTWLAAGGGRFARVAADASPAQQMLVFERYEPSHPGAWPVTVPACS